MERVIKFEYIVKIETREGIKYEKYTYTLDEIEKKIFTHKEDILVAKRQFTGLTDKNGKEIYEGDVVKWGMHKGSEENFHRYAMVVINPDIQFNIIHYVNSKTGGYVKGDDYIFHFGRFAYKDTNRHLEVIGNIYENPELLSTDKTKTV